MKRAFIMVLDSFGIGSSKDIKPHFCGLLRSGAGANPAIDHGRGFRRAVAQRDLIAFF
jgi:phosphopentomutase